MLARNESNPAGQEVKPTLDMPVARRLISRRDLLRRAAGLGGLTALTSFLEACRQAGLETPAGTSALSSGPAVTPNSMPTTTPSSTPVPAAMPAPEPSPTTSPSATPAVSTFPTAPPRPMATTETGVARVAFVKTRDRVDGVRRALDLLNINPVRGKRTFLKPNFNSPDLTPGSTHPDVLRTLVQELWTMGASAITVGDRSGMANTRNAMEQKGVFAMAGELGFEALVFDELGEKEWTSFQPPDSHWQRGFLFARPCLEAEALVQTCCLKTHRFGGHFTMSLKNSVGMVAKYGPGGYNYMQELHSSPAQRLMIAEVNTAYTPALIVMDGVETFVNGGPEAGKRAWGEAILAGTDRVALDAVGVALLRHLGTTPEVSQGLIFQQEQIARAVELGLGAAGPDKIELVTADAESETYAAQIREILMRG
jgi:uncharacterized protein (DUF362 family)